MPVPLRTPFIEFEVLVWPQGEAPTRLETAALAFIRARRDPRRSVRLGDLADFLCIGQPATLELVNAMWRQSWIWIDLDDGEIYLRQEVANLANAAEGEDAARFLGLGSTAPPQRLMMCYDLLTGQVAPSLERLWIDPGDDRDTFGPSPDPVDPFPRPLDGWLNVSPAALQVALSEHPRYRRIKADGLKPPAADVAPPRGEIRLDSVRYAKLWFRLTGANGSVRLEPDNHRDRRRPGGSARGGLSASLNRIGGPIGRYAIGLHPPDAERPSRLGLLLREGLNQARDKGAPAPEPETLRLDEAVGAILDGARQGSAVALREAEQEALELWSDLRRGLIERAHFSLKTLKPLPNRAAVERAGAAMLSAAAAEGDRQILALRGVAAQSPGAQSNFNAWSKLVRPVLEAGRAGLPIWVGWSAAGESEKLPVEGFFARLSDAAKSAKGAFHAAQSRQSQRRRQESLHLKDGVSLLWSSLCALSPAAWRGCGLLAEFRSPNALFDLEQHLAGEFGDSAAAGDLRAHARDSLSADRSLRMPWSAENPEPPEPPGWSALVEEEEGEERTPAAEDPASLLLRAEDWRSFDRAFKIWNARAESAEWRFGAEIHEEALRLLQAASPKSPLAIGLFDLRQGGIAEEMQDLLAACARKRNPRSLWVALSRQAGWEVGERAMQEAGVEILRPSLEANAAPPSFIIAEGAALVALEGISAPARRSTTRSQPQIVGLLLKGASAAEAVRAMLSEAFDLPFFPSAPSAPPEARVSLAGLFARWRVRAKDDEYGLGLAFLEAQDPQIVERMRRALDSADEAFDRAAFWLRTRRALAQPNGAAAIQADLAEGPPGSSAFLETIFAEPRDEEGLFQREILFSALGGTPLRSDLLPWPGSGSAALLGYGLGLLGPDRGFLADHLHGEEALGASSLGGLVAALAEAARRRGSAAEEEKGFGVSAARIRVLLEAAALPSQASRAERRLLLLLKEAVLRRLNGADPDLAQLWRHPGLLAARRAVEARDWAALRQAVVQEGEWIGGPETAPRLFDALLKREAFAAAETLVAFWPRRAETSEREARRETARRKAKSRLAQHRAEILKLRRAKILAEIASAEFDRAGQRLFDAIRAAEPDRLCAVEAEARTDLRALGALLERLTREAAERLRRRAAEASAESRLRVERLLEANSAPTAAALLDGALGQEPDAPARLDLSLAQEGLSRDLQAGASAAERLAGRADGALQKDALRALLGLGAGGPPLEAGEAGEALRRICLAFDARTRPEDVELLGRDGNLLRFLCRAPGLLRAAPQETLSAGRLILAIPRDPEAPAAAANPRGGEPRPEDGFVLSGRVLRMRGPGRALDAEALASALLHASEEDRIRRLSAEIAGLCGAELALGPPGEKDEALAARFRRFSPGAEFRFDRPMGNAETRRFLRELRLRGGAPFPGLEERDDSLALATEDLILRWSGGFLANALEIFRICVAERLTRPAQLAAALQARNTLRSALMERVLRASGASLTLAEEIIEAVILSSGEDGALETDLLNLAPGLTPESLLRFSTGSGLLTPSAGSGAARRFRLAPGNALAGLFDPDFRARRRD